VDGSGQRLLLSRYLRRWGFHTFSFSSFYAQADLYHYTGDAIYPAMETQIIDDVVKVHATVAVVEFPRTVQSPNL
jgi:hypothetical protein